eukprot:CAMPEP_0179443802 /NCGR_PEP_ID=MMETSP0799-20121207/27273_1 /TAXON_ID=46947 /ORGANISM="Geminigera cryophila, Strain CCMP2564" /LENGTH=179 /DNA_ID=CAMNT_0021230259 /DNA_START=312 /DNA_END=848 /DNA_ORIENTATION=-
MSWKRMFVMEAKTHEMTFREYLRHVLNGEGYSGVARRVLPGYIGNSLSSMGLFTTYALISPFPLLVDWQPTSAHAPVPARVPLLWVFPHVFPYGVAAGCVHAAISMPAKTLLQSHYAYEPMWMLLQPATPATHSPRMGSVVVGGDETRSGIRKIKHIIRTNPLILPHHLSTTILAQRLW